MFRTCLVTMLMLATSLALVEETKRPRVGTLQGENPDFAVVTEHVFFDVIVHDFYNVSDHLEGRFTVAVFGDLAPMTALNFISLAKGFRKGKEFYSYNNTVIHRIVPDFVIQMGDVHNRRGAGGISIYGDKFHDEPFIMSHGASGMVSMANTGPDTNNSQFFITLQKTRWLDGHHVVFGKVIAGMDIIQKIGEIRSYHTGHPMKKVHVVASGTLGLQTKYEITKEQLTTNSEDLSVDELNIPHVVEE